MSVKEVPMWRVECDVCGDGNDGEFWAWNDHGHALDEWVESGNYATDDGAAYHEECVPAEVCPNVGDDEGHHVWESDGTCGEGCGRTIADVVAAGASS